MKTKNNIVKSIKIIKSNKIVPLKINQNKISQKIKMNNKNTYKIKMNNKSIKKKRKMKINLKNL